VYFTEIYQRTGKPAASKFKLNYCGKEAAVYATKSQYVYQDTRLRCLYVQGSQSLIKLDATWTSAGNIGNLRVILKFNPLLVRQASVQGRMMIMMMQ
jgi:hypothetical protein